MRCRIQAANLDHQGLVLLHNLPSAEDFHMAAHMASSTVDSHRIVATTDSLHRDFDHKGSMHMGSIIERNLHMGSVVTFLAFLTFPAYPACPTYLAYFITASQVIVVVVTRLLVEITLAVVATYQIIIKLEVAAHRIDLLELIG